jgi:hypothetical protein
MVLLGVIRCRVHHLSAASLAMINSQRYAQVTVQQLSNGYWRGEVTIKVPQLTPPQRYENDWFHSAGEALGWARGQVELLVMSV